LMDNKRALVVGERSYGKGSVQELIPLEQKSGELKLTVAYYYLPSGRLVHRRKDATDWGVRPQIPVSVDLEHEKKAFEYRLQQELFQRPMPKATTQAMTQPSTTQVIDVQLQRAVDVMMAWLVFAGGSQEISAVLAATEPSSTQPATVPTTMAATAPTSTATTGRGAGALTRPSSRNAPSTRPTRAPVTVPD